MGRSSAKTIGVLEAKGKFSSLLAEVQAGGRYYITKHGRPIAEVRPIPKRARVRKAGFARGLFSYVAADFDAPLDDFAEYLE